MDVCRICGSTEHHERFLVREMMFGLREEFTYFQCAACRCLQIDSIPADMTKYYPSNYYSMQARFPEPGAIGRRLCRIDSWIRLHVANGLLGQSRRTRIFDWMRGTGTGYRSAVLDVGCGNGKLLHELRLYGFRDLTGVDPYVACESHDDGITIRKCDLSQLEHNFDLIMMHHTFEHVPDPERTMADAASRLRPGRFLLLRIPLVDCFAWRHYGVNWLALDAPRHFHLHTEKSIGILAERTGFVVDRVTYDSGAHQFWGSEQYLRDIPHRSERSHEDHPARSIFDRSQIHEFERKSAALNDARDGDSACFYLRRR